MGCDHEKRRFAIEVMACPVCEPVRVQTLEALEETVRMEAAVEDFTEAISDASARDAADGLRSLALPADNLELHSPPVEARCRCCNRRLTDRASIGAGEGPMCREGRCRKKAG